MKSFVLLLFVISIVFLATGYQKKMITNSKTKTIVEYRFMPRSLYDEQMAPINLEQNFVDMFNKQDVFFRYQLLVISYQLLAVGCWLLAVGCW